MFLATLKIMSFYVFTSNNGTSSGNSLEKRFFCLYFGLSMEKYENHQHKLQLRIALVVKESQFISCKYFLILDHSSKE